MLLAVSAVANAPLRRQGRDIFLFPCFSGDTEAQLLRLLCSRSEDLRRIFLAIVALLLLGLLEFVGVTLSNSHVEMFCRSLFHVADKKNDTDSK